MEKKSQENVENMDDIKSNENNSSDFKKSQKKSESKIEKFKSNLSKKAKLKSQVGDRIKELEIQVEELKNEKLMCLAEFENFRKRKEKESFEIREKTIVSLILDILPMIDNFEMSLKMTDNKEMFIKGVEMIHSNLISLLEEHQVKEFIPLVGEKFDPNFHDPILIEDEKAESEKVLEVVKKGYKHKDKIILPSRVKVKKIE